MKNYHLVYQCGIANVFRCTLPESEGGSPHYVRVLQSSYRSAEDYCHGLIEAGMEVSVWHSDVAGDALSGPEWRKGPGGLWADKKFPPALALYADAA